MYLRECGCGDSAQLNINLLFDGVADGLRQ